MWGGVGGVWGGVGGVWGGVGGVWGGVGGVWGGVGGAIAEYGTPGFGGRTPVVWSARDPRSTSDDSRESTGRSPSSTPASACIPGSPTR